MIRVIPRLALFLFLVGLATLALAVEPFGARHPDLSPDGSRIAFSWRGDIWVAPTAGGDARRLTVHGAHDTYPVWSPDGREIAFSSDRHGNPDVFVVGLDGGAPERLTFHSDADAMFDWSPGGDALYFGSRRESRQNLVYRVPREGGRPTRVIHDLAWQATPSPDGQWIAYLRGYTNWWRRGYRGPASRDIWIRHVDGGPSHHLVAWPGDDDHPHWSPDGKAILFQSEREDGVKNLWRQDLRFGEGRIDPAGPPTQISHLKSDGMQWLCVSRDGGMAAFESEGRLWTMSTAGGKPTPLAVDCPGDLKRNPLAHRVISRGATEYAFAPGEKQLAFVVQGEIYCGLVKDGELSDAVRLTKTDAREKDLAWLNENELLYVSDRHGGDDLFLLRSGDEDEERLGRSRYREEVRLTDDPANESRPDVSPDGETVLYLKGTDFLWGMDPDGENERLLVDEPEVLHVDWSPDSRYLAYSTTNHGSAEDIFVVDLTVEEFEPVNVSTHPNDDFHPLWTGDGKRLAWASRTDEGDYSIRYLWLTNEEADKSRREREREEEEEESGDKEDKAKDDDEEAEEEPALEVKIDWNEIPDRIRTVTTVRGFYWDYDQSPDGKHYALRTDMVEGEMDLWSVDWDGDNLRRLTRGGARPDRMLWSEDSKSVRYVGGEQVREVANEKGASPKTYGFSAPITVDARARRLQKFGEAWRLLEDGFYDENFHGKDWRALREKYEPMAAEAVMYEDFKDVLRSMIGELNASHLGAWGGPRNSSGNDRTGLLGFTPDDAYEGPGLRVAKVLHRGPLDREGRRVEAGEVILAIDGEEIAAGANPYPLLNHKAGEEVDLLVQAEGGDTRTITVEPARSVWWQDYRHWMDENRAMVDELSGGRLGYLHMSAMGDGNWDAFLADLFAHARGKEGLILDIRYNNGGSIHDRVLTFLSRRTYGYTKSRGKRSGTIDAQHRWDGPIVLLTNERSYSDGEIFPWGFKALGLGRVVGMPTFGAVIGTNNVQLIDGTTFRVPGSGWWRLNPDGSIGDNLENIPVQPDIMVPDVPEEALQGRDAQVEAGVAECLRMLSKDEGR